MYIMSSCDKNSLLCEIVQKLMQKFNIDEYKINIDGGTGNGDGYMGEIIFFHIIINDNKKLDLVLKSAKTNETIKNELGGDILYFREYDMYTKVVSALRQFTEHKNFQGLDSFIPKLWFAKAENDQICLVLENLKQQKFHVRDRGKPMDKDHMELLFETYGKWHGISMAYKDQHPDEFRKIVENWKDPREKILQKFGLPELFKKEVGIIKIKLVEKGRQDLLMFFEGVENEMENILFRHTLEEKDALVVSHGDNWSNNYMFKYEDSGENSKPSQVYLLDFQLSRTESPAMDLSSTLYNMGDRNCLNSFNDLISIYHKSLSKTLKELGSDPKILFTMNDVKRHWKKHGLFAVVNIFIFLRIAMCKSEEAPDFNKISENGGEFYGAFSFEMENMEIFWDRAMEVFIHYGELCKKFANS